MGCEWGGVSRANCTFATPSRIPRVLEARRSVVRTPWSKVCRDKSLTRLRAVSLNRVPLGVNAAPPPILESKPAACRAPLFGRKLVRPSPRNRRPPSKIADSARPLHQETEPQPPQLGRRRAELLLPSQWTSPAPPAALLPQLAHASCATRKAPAHACAQSTAMIHTRRSSGSCCLRAAQEKHAGAVPKDARTGCRSIGHPLRLQLSTRTIPDTCATSTDRCRWASICGIRCSWSGSC